MTQCFPGVVLGLYWKRVTARGIFAGMIVGELAAVWLMLTHRDPVFGVNAGFAALCLNFAVAAAGSLAFPPRETSPAGRARTSPPARH